MTSRLLVKKSFMTKRVSIILFFVFFFALIGVLAYTMYELRAVFQNLFKGQEALQAAVEEYLENVGAGRAIILMLLQFCSVLITVMPAQPVLIVTGLSYGIGFGVMICWLSVILANIVIYFLFKKLGDHVVSLFPNYEKWEKKIILRYKKGGRIANIAMLYFVPVIPYGMIALIASRSRIRFIPYLIVTSLGVLPSLILTIMVSGSLLSGNIYFTLSILGLAVIGIFLAWYIKRKIGIDSAIEK